MMYSPDGSQSNKQHEIYYLLRFLEIQDMKRSLLLFIKKLEFLWAESAAF